MSITIDRMSMIATEIGLDMEVSGETAFFEAPNRSSISVTGFERQSVAEFAESLRSALRSFSVSEEMDSVNLEESEEPESHRKLVIEDKQAFENAAKTLSDRSFA